MSHSEKFLVEARQLRPGKIAVWMGGVPDEKSHAIHGVVINSDDNIIAEIKLRHFDATADGAKVRDLMKAGQIVNMMGSSKGMVFHVAEPVEPAPYPEYIRNNHSRIPNALAAELSKQELISAMRSGKGHGQEHG